MDLVSRHQSDERRSAGIRSAEIHHYNSIDWSAVRRIVYQVQQASATGTRRPIYKLRQRLVVVPRPGHGNQRLLHSRQEIVDRSPCRIAADTSFTEVSEC